MKDKILLFIPCYNCEKQIVRVLGQLDGQISKYITQVIIVNNRSTDNGEVAIQDYLKKHKTYVDIKLLRNNGNYGLGGSHKVAFQYAIDNGFDYVIVLHGDDQGNVHDFENILKRKTYLKYDSILGSRFEKESKLINYSKIRIWGNHIFNVFMTIMLQRRITDLGSGLNMYSVKYLKKKFYMNFPNSLTFNVYMLNYGVITKSKFRFESLTWREEDQISNAKFIKQSKEITGLTFKTVFAPKKVFNTNENEYSKINYGYEVVYEHKGENHE
ncbi:glycosyltransferase family 2 protein [Clostridium cagae]|uniref:glycosyltransferase family 2 protein n=1 Tax=Clostridium cagae TaxID=2080751 RepID=UPI003F770C34